jgi:hypothetical protein
VAKTRRTETRCRPQHVGSELDDFEDELKEDADEHEAEIDRDVDEDENEPAPSPAHRPYSLPPLLTNYLLPPLSLDEMRTKIEDDYYAVLLKSLLTRLIEAHELPGRRGRARAPATSWSGFGYEPSRSSLAKTRPSCLNERLARAGAARGVRHRWPTLASPLGPRCRSSCLSRRRSAATDCAGC